MKTLDVISTQLNFNNLLNQAGYNLSEIVVKRYSAAPAFNEGHWLFIAEQDNRYIEVVSLLSKASESGEQHVDIFINMFEVGGSYSADPYEGFGGDGGVVVQYHFSVLIVCNTVVEYDVYSHSFQEFFCIG